MTFELLSCVRIDVEKLGAPRNKAAKLRGLVVGIGEGSYEVLWERGECGWVNGDYLIPARLG